MNTLTPEQKSILHKLAWGSLRSGLEIGYPLSIKAEDSALNEIGASFVTLEKSGQLRGCMGTLEAHQPLVVDITNNTFNAAFRDPRFPAVERNELEDIQLQISVLTEPEAIEFSSEHDLLSQLRPGIDGIIFEDNTHRSTFLPQVWEQLPEPERFMAHLKNKAGLSDNYWSPSVKILRYRVDKF